MQLQDYLLIGIVSAGIIGLIVVIINSMVDKKAYVKAALEKECERLKALPFGELLALADDKNQVKVSYDGRDFIRKLKLNTYDVDYYVINAKVTIHPVGKEKLTEETIVTREKRDDEPVPEKDE